MFVVFKSEVELKLGYTNDLKSYVGYIFFFFILDRNN